MKSKISIIIAVLVLTGCLEAQLVPPQGDEEQTTNEQEPHALWSASALLRPTEGEEGNGFAEVQFQDDRNIQLAIRVSLPELAEGEYIACIERSSPPNRIHLDSLTATENGSYSLMYQEKVENLTDFGDLADYDKIVIILETSEGERPVLGGKLTMI